MEPLQRMSILVNNQRQRQSRAPCQTPLEVGLSNDSLRRRNQWNELVTSSMTSPLKPHHLRSSTPRDKRRPIMQRNAPIVLAPFKVVHHAKDVDCCFLRTGRCQRETVVYTNIWLILKIRFCNLVDTQCEKWKSEPMCWALKNGILCI